MSQLELATLTESSARHLSFIETGRSRPSAKVIHRLSEALDIPLRERNELLVAAGLPAEYPERPLDDVALAHYRRIVTRMLEAHDPFPAFAIDRWWHIVEANAAATRMFGPIDPERDMIELTYAEGPLRALIDNWAEVAWAGVDRLRRELAHSGGDERLAAMLERAERHLADTPRPHPTEVAGVVCPRFRIGDQRIETVGTIMSFGTPREVVLEELRVELIFPADEKAEAFFRAMAG